MLIGEKPISSQYDFGSDIVVLKRDENPPKVQADSGFRIPCVADWDLDSDFFMKQKENLHFMQLVLKT